MELHYNELTGEGPQTNTPWHGWVSEETIAEFKARGWVVVDENFVPPKKISVALKEATSRIKTSADDAYVGGFYSDASGTMLYYDSDDDTQKLIPNIYSRTKEDDWETKVRYPGLCEAGKAPIRARPTKDSSETEKSIQFLNKQQLKMLMDDMDDAFYAVKVKVWQLQATAQTILNDNTTYDTEAKKVSALETLVVW